MKFRKSDKTFSYTHLEKDTEPEGEEDDADAVAQLPQLLSNVQLDDTSLAKAEQNVWKKAYAHLGATPFVAKLASKEALVLPFSFCYQAYGELPVQLSSYLPCSDAFGDGLPDWGVAQPLLEDSAKICAVDNLFTAITTLATLASKPVCHLDIKWEHLALLPVFEENTLVRLEPILIDLAEVDLTLSPTDAISSMCDAVLNSNWFSKTRIGGGKLNYCSTLMRPAIVYPVTDGGRRTRWVPSSPSSLIMAWMRCTNVWRATCKASKHPSSLHWIHWKLRVHWLMLCLIQSVRSASTHMVTEQATVHLLLIETTVLVMMQLKTVLGPVVIATTNHVVQ